MQIFCDVISEVVLGSFWLMLPGLGRAQPLGQSVSLSFHWKPGSSPSLLSL